MKGQGDSAATAQQYAEWTLEERLVQLFTAEQSPFVTHMSPHGLKAAARPWVGGRHTPEASPTPDAAPLLSSFI